MASITGMCNIAINVEVLGEFLPKTRLKGMNGKYLKLQYSSCKIAHTVYNQISSRSEIIGILRNNHCTIYVQIVHTKRCMNVS